MPRLGESRQAIFDSLAGRYGPMPLPGGGLASADDARGPFEVIAAVFLGLLAEPRTAESALGALRDAGLIEPGALAQADPLELDDVFRQARVPLAARSLKPLARIAGWAIGRDLDADAVAHLSTEAIRESWWALNGVGPALADALLLFALGRPTYPVDRASYRILVRHGWLDPSSDSDEARSVLEGIAPGDSEALGQLALGFARLGRDACKPSAPRCERCPLRSLLPEGGPVEVEG